MVFPIKSELYKAIFSSVSGKLLVYIFQVICMGVYARLFSPESFGVIAAIQVFLMFFQLLSDVGFGPAIINERNFFGSKRDGIFTFTILFGGFLSIVFFLFSALVSEFYNFDYSSISAILSFGVFFSALTVVPLASLQKDSKFIHISFVEASAEAFALVVVFVLSSKVEAIYALSCKFFIQPMFRFCFLWWGSKNTSTGRAKLGRELSYIKDIWSFSSYQLMFNVINYFSRNLDNILVGKFLGVQPLAIYDRAYQLMRYPLLLTSFAMTPAIQPVLMKKRHDTEYIVTEHNCLSNRLLCISLFISFFMFWNSESIVLVLFGAQWLEAIPLVSILTSIIPVQAVLCTSGSFYQLMNKPKLLFISGAIAAVVNVTFICIGVYLGELYYIALLVCASYTLNFVIGYYILFKYCFKVSIAHFYFGLFDVCRSVFPPVAIYVLLSEFLLIDNAGFGLISLLMNISLAAVCILPFRRKLMSYFR